MWASLAEKYERRLDEDDIVDLKNETLIKDCGVLRSTADVYGIGRFAEEHDRQLQDDEADLVDDDLDEIDAFADNTDCTSQAETDIEEAFELHRSRRLPPVQELDPDDAADLAEFLEAEKQRRERFGDPESDEDAEEVVGPGSRLSSPASSGENEDSQAEDVDKPNTSSYRSVSILSGSPELDVIRYGTEESANADSLSARSATMESHEDISEAGSVSDPDEIDAWDQDTSNVTYCLVENHDHEVNDLDDSYGQGTSTDEEQASQRPPEKMAKTRRPEHTIIDNLGATKGIDKANRNLRVQQLQTPPRSSSASSSYETIEDSRPASDEKRKHLVKDDSSKKPKNRQKLSEVSMRGKESATTHVSKKQPKGISQKVPVGGATRSNTFPEVVIPVRSSSIKYKSPPYDSDPYDNRAMAEVKSSSRKNKGKSADRGEPYEDEPHKHPVTSSGRVQTRAPVPEESSSQRERAKTISNPKKRRRVSSPKVNNVIEERRTRRSKTSRNYKTDRRYEEHSQSNTCTDSDESDYDSGMTRIIFLDFPLIKTFR